MGKIHLAKDTEFQIRTSLTLIFPHLGYEPFEFLVLFKAWVWHADKKICGPHANCLSNWWLESIAHWWPISKYHVRFIGHTGFAHWWPISKYHVRFKGHTGYMIKNILRNYLLKNARLLQISQSLEWEKRSCLSITIHIFTKNRGLKIHVYITFKRDFPKNLTLKFNKNWACSQPKP